MDTYVRPFHKDSSFEIQLKCQLAALQNSIHPIVGYVQILTPGLERNILWCIHL